MLQEAITPILLTFILIFINRDAYAAVAKNSEKIENQTTQYIADVPAGRKNKNYTKEYKMYYLKKLAENFYKYKNTNKYSYLLSKTWGAGGMPFNVLYTPNAHQQKVLTTSPKFMFNSARLKNKDPEMYSLMMAKETLEKSVKDKILKKHYTQRKYYSPIPQFFVSYGW